MTPAGDCPRHWHWRVVGLRLRACVVVLVAVVVWAGVALAQDQVPAAGPPSIKVQADSSGALIPEKQRAPVETGAGGAPQGGGAAPKSSGGAAPQAGGGSSGALDYAGWERMAVRAEAAIVERGISNPALERLRTQLADWREALLGAQNANSARIATIREQIAALGPAPAEGEAEVDEIAKRRSQLTDQLVRLQAPGIAADEAYRRADGLIREIDRVLRERQADALLKLWPAPINPTNWPEALGALSQTATALWSDAGTRWAQPVARRGLIDNLPLILPLLVFAIAVLWRGRRWVDWVIAMLQALPSARSRRIWSFVASTALIIVPTLGFVALAAALNFTGMLGEVGQAITKNLAGIGATLFGAIWLGQRIFPATEAAGALLALSAEKRREGRVLTGSFGVLLALSRVLRVAMDPLAISDAASSVLNFPIIALGAVLLVRLSRLIRLSMTADVRPGEEARSNYRGRLTGILARVVLGIGVVGPVLAAIGYISAGSALIFPAAMSLGLIGLLYLTQRLISDIYAMVSRSENPEQDALVPVLISFGLVLATLPVFALIWGARWADLTEVWTRFQEGFQLGETRISPTDFLIFAIIFAIGLTLTRLFQGAMKNSILPRTGLDQGGQNAIVSGLGYLGILVAALVAINSTGIDLSGLAIVAGALSVGIGFGLQTIVSNFVSGIILLIERPISEGDWIEVGPVQGIVSSISVRATRIQTFDRSDVIVPNSDLISGRVTNWTRFSLTGRLIVPVTAPFTADSRKIATILMEIAEAQPLTLLSPAPIVALMGFGPETMLFEIRIILRDVNFSVEVRTEINHQIAARFAAEGVVFTNAHRDYLKRVADEAAAEAEAVEEERQHLEAVALVLGDLPAPRRATLAPPPVSDRKGDLP